MSFSLHIFNTSWQSCSPASNGLLKERWSEFGLLTENLGAQKSLVEGAEIFIQSEQYAVLLESTLGKCEENSNGNFS